MKVHKIKVALIDPHTETQIVSSWCSKKQVVRNEYYIDTWEGVTCDGCKKKKAPDSFDPKDVFPLESHKTKETKKP